MLGLGNRLPNAGKLTSRRCKKNESKATIDPQAVHPTSKAIHSKLLKVITLKLLLD